MCQRGNTLGKESQEGFSKDVILSWTLNNKKKQAMWRLEDKAFKLQTGGQCGGSVVNKRGWVNDGAERYKESDHTEPWRP